MSGFKRIWKVLLLAVVWAAATTVGYVQAGGNGAVGGFFVGVILVLALGAVLVGLDIRNEKKLKKDEF